MNQKKFISISVLLTLAVTVALLSWPGLAFSADTPPLEQQTVRVWTTADGLPHDSVNRIVQDEQGYLWIASWEGPIRFNGRTFTVFDNRTETELPDNGMLDVSIDPTSNDVLFAGARGGLSRYDGENWQALPAEPPRIHDVLIDDKENWWFATFNKGLIKRNASGERRPFNKNDGLPGQSVHVLLQSSQGVIWAGTNNGLAVYDAGQDRFNLITDIPGRTVLTLLETNSGQLLVGVGNQVYVSDSQFSPRFKLWPVSMKSAITKFYQDSHGRVLVGTHKHGITQLADTEQPYINTNNGLPNNHILDIYEDREANIWVGTHGGLVQFRSTLFRTLGAAQGLADSYTRALLARENGQVLVAGLGGLNAVDNGKVVRIPETAVLEDRSLLSLASTSDRLFVGSYNDGLFILKDGQLEAHFGRADGLINNEVRQILPLSNNRVLLGTVVGLIELDLTDIEQPVITSYTTDDGLPHNFISALHRDSNGKIWLGTLTGLATFDANTRTIATVPLVSTQDAQYVFSIRQFGDFLWLATDRGALAHHLASGSWHEIGRTQGLPFDHYFDAVQDSAGHVWLGNSRGLLRIPHDEITDLINGRSEKVRFRYFDEADGLGSAQMNTGGPAMLKTADTMYFAMSKGVASIAIDSFSDPNDMPPPVVISSVVVDQTPITNNQEIAAESQRIQFNYAGLGYQHSEGIRYQVKLHGFDKSWVDRENAIQVEYTDLAAGNYRFAVRSAYPDGDWSTPAYFNLKQLPSFWEKPWPWVLVALFILLLCFILIKLRLRVLAQSRQRLVELVREQTRELEDLAHQDSLTGLANRRAFDQQLQQSVNAKTLARQQQNEHSHPLCLAILDIDNFKVINDTHLHSAGDIILQRLAARLQQTTREGDLIARWGGEEFALLIHDVELSTAVEICDRVRTQVEQMSFDDIAEELRVTVSIGLAQQLPGEDHSMLLVRADQALYQAKHAGRNRLKLAEVTGSS